MALAPWDLVSWQSQSETSSLCGGGAGSDFYSSSLQIGNTGRRDSYLRATRTPMPNNGLDRNDSFRLSKNCSVITMSPLRLNRKLSSDAKKDNNNNLSPPNNNNQPEIFKTPSGDVSLVITDHSTTVANGGSTLTKQQKKITSPDIMIKSPITSPSIRVEKSDQVTLEPAQISPEPSDDELYVKKPTPPNKSTPRPPYLSRDIFVLCIVFIFAFSAVRAVQVLQSSVNDKGKMGTMALSIFYFTLAVTVILVPPTCHKRISDRSLLCLGIFFLFIWLAANLVPHPLILLPAAMFGGAGLTLAWTAQMNAFSLYFSSPTPDQKQQPTESRMSLRRILLTNNTLFALFQSSHIWGNLSVAAIFLTEIRPDDPNSALTVKIIAASNRSIEYNMTIGPGWYFFPPLFKVDLVPVLANRYDDLWIKCRKNVDFFPPISTWTSMIGFDQFNVVTFPTSWALAWLVGLGLIALLLAILFFHPHPPPKPESGDDDDEDEEIEFDFSTRIQKFVVAHLFQLFDGPHFRLLIPLLFFNGLEQGFLYTDYTKIFLSCMFGLSSVGVAVMITGVMSCVFSAAASFAAKRSVSREILISIAAIVHLALAAFLYQWQAYPSIPIFVIIVPVIYGLCDAVWQTHCYVLITKVAGDDHQLAFSNFRILQSLGIATSCILSFVAGLGLKILILVTNLLLSVLCYAILENRIRREELAIKDRERLAGAFKQLTMVMGAAGIRNRNLRMPPINRTVTSPVDGSTTMFGIRPSPQSPTLASKFTSSVKQHSSASEPTTTTTTKTTYLKPTTVIEAPNKANVISAGNNSNNPTRVANVTINVSEDEEIL